MEIMYNIWIKKSLKRLQLCVILYVTLSSLQENAAYFVGSVVEVEAISI